MGLLLLRASIGAISIAQGVAYLAGQRDSAAAAWIIGLLLAGGGLSLLAGLLTPIGGAMIGIGILAPIIAHISAPSPNFLEERLAAFLVVVGALAIVFTGPGALSLDSYFFGRREITIPRAGRLPEE